MDQSVVELNVIAVKFVFFLSVVPVFLLHELVDKLTNFTLRYTLC